MLVGRCVPLIRSLVSIPAGFRRMPFATFTLYTAIGSLIWNTALIGAGYVAARQLGGRRAGARRRPVRRHRADRGRHRLVRVDAEAERTGVTASKVVARAPGRVNIIGDHTDYTGGLCLPMAIDMGVTIEGRPVAGGVVRLASDSEPEPAVVPLDVAEPSGVEPAWARYVAGVVAQVRPADGFEGTVHSTLPTGVGLSSSAALEVAVALAIGADDSDPVALARLCQAAEHAARGVPTGILDQVSSICGVAGHALLLDCHTVTVTPVRLPPADVAEWVVLVPTGGRDLATSGYSERVAELARAEAEIGPLRLAALDDVAHIADPVVRRRARHVVTENHRVRAFAEVVGCRRPHRRRCADEREPPEPARRLRVVDAGHRPAVRRSRRDRLASSAHASRAAAGAAAPSPSPDRACSMVVTGRGWSDRATVPPAT